MFRQSLGGMLNNLGNVPFLHLVGVSIGVSFVEKLNGILIEKTESHLFTS